MAKLNKSEIEAVANKAHHALTEAANARLEKLRKEFTPDEMASKLFELAKQRDEKRKLISQLDLEAGELRRQIGNILGEHYDYYGYGCSYHDVFGIVTERACNLTPVPSKESIIDDVTIAAIDRDFDTVKFIETLVNKFNK